MTYRYNIAELNSFKKELLESLSKDFWKDTSDRLDYPPIDIYETSDSVIVVAALPGLKKATDVDINYTDNSLNIKGNITKDYPQNALINEIISGEFEREIVLPVIINSKKVKAYYKNGLLTISLSKEIKCQEHKINIDSFD